MLVVCVDNDSNVGDKQEVESSLRPRGGMNGGSGGGGGLCAVISLPLDGGGLAVYSPRGLESRVAQRLTINIILLVQNRCYLLLQASIRIIII